MKLSNKVPFLLIFPVSAAAIYFLGMNVVDTASQSVESSRQWLLIFIGVYVANYTFAWMLRYSWPVTMIRMLGCGLFAYIAISELIDVLGGMWGHWLQLLGGEGGLPLTLVAATRYTTVAWLVALVMMILCIAMGFEHEAD